MAFMATRRVEPAVKTNQIMARFRPIAPKPVLVPPPGSSAGNAVLSSLQSRSRKRGRRNQLVPAPADKRLRGAPCYPLPTCRDAATDAVCRSAPWATSPPPPPPPPPPATATRRFPVERDLLRKLQEPKVIVPRPARPVRTTICVDTNSIVTGANTARLAVCRMTAEQVEAELDRDGLPAIISGPGNRVHRANEAYKALVGQPVCPWLDTLLGGAGASKRINGEVVLDVRRFTSTEPTRPAGAGGAFSCNSRISWERDGALASVAAPCDVMRLDCSSSDHFFVWRFDTTRGSVFYCPA